MLITEAWKWMFGTDELDQWFSICGTGTFLEP